MSLPQPSTVPKYIIHGLVHSLRDRNLVIYFRNFWLTDRLISIPIGTLFRKYFPEIPKKSEFRRNSDRKVQLSQELLPKSESELATLSIKTMELQHPTTQPNQYDRIHKGTGKSIT